MAWKKEQSGKPNSRPKGARNWLSDSVLKEFIAHWEEHGSVAVYRNCKENMHIGAVLSFLPKDLALLVEKNETPRCIAIIFVAWSLKKGMGEVRVEIGLFECP